MIKTHGAKYSHAFLRQSLILFSKTEVFYHLAN